MAIAIQFFGTDNVVSMATNRNCPRWAIFNGRQFLFKFDGDDQEESKQFLSQILDALEESQSDAIYTLKFYEETTKIKESTPCDGSFNFKLTDPATREEKRNTMVMGSVRNTERIDRLETMLETLLERTQTDNEEPEEKEPDPASLNGVLLGLLKEPEKIVQMIGAVKTLFGGAKAVHAIGNIPAVKPESSDEDKKILQAVEVLKLHDPKLGDHLLKLAAIAKDDPGAWKFLISTLEAK